MNKKWTFILDGLILGLSLLLSACHPEFMPDSPKTPHVKNLGYFNEAENFSFNFTGIDYPGNMDEKTYLRFDAKYSGQNSLDSSSFFDTSLNFRQVQTDAPISILVTSKYASFIKLTPNHEYQITIQRIGFMNYDSDLMITENGQMIFLGVSGGYPAAGKTPFESSPIQITNRETLINHYKLNPTDCVAKYTNTKLRFEANGEAVELHQGESGKLGNYEINLLIARDIQFPDPNPCYDYYDPVESVLVFKN